MFKQKLFGSGWFTIVNTVEFLRLVVKAARTWPRNYNYSDGVPADDQIGKGHCTKWPVCVVGSDGVM